MEQIGIHREVHVLAADTLHQPVAALDRDQTVLLTVHHQHRRPQRGRALRHRLAHDEQASGDPGGQLAVVHHRIGFVGGHHLRIAGHRAGVELFDGHTGREAAQQLRDGHQPRRDPELRVDRRPGQHHRRVVPWVLGAVGEHHAAAHAVAEDDTGQIGVFPGRDADEGVEVTGVLADVAQVDALAAGASVAAVVEGVDEEPGGAEALGDVVIAAGVLGVAVGEHDHPAGGHVGSPGVVDDPYAADAAEMSLAAGAGHGT